MSNINECENIIECLLFVNNGPLSIEKISEITGLEKKKISFIIKKLISDYDNSSKPFKIYEIAKGYKFGTKSQYARWVKKLLESKKETKLSRAALETLAIIAYNQPVTRTEIEKLRGVNSSGVLLNLLKYRFIRICGKKRVPGNPLLYRVTDLFLLHFGLKNLSDLPRLSEIGSEQNV